MSRATRHQKGGILSGTRARLRLITGRVYERSQANALLAGRKRVEAEDLKSAVVSVLSHRIRLKPSLRYVESPADYVQKKFSLLDLGSLEDSKEGG